MRHRSQTGHGPWPQITRIPHWRPLDWIRVKPEVPGLGGKALRVKSLTCSFDAGQTRPTWRVHFGDGRSGHANQVERYATPEEIAHAEALRAV